MSTAPGGYIRGPWWQFTGDDESATRRCYVIAWGQIVTDPQEKYKDLRVIRFAIKTGRGAGRNEKHLVCVGYGEQLTAVIMRALERGDTVFVAGTWVEHQRVKTKKGIKQSYEMQVRFIVPQEAIALLLNVLSLPQITEALKQRENADADVWESDY